MIQGLLTAREWTQEDLASAVGTKQNYVSRWLKGVEPRGTVRDRIFELARDSGVLDNERGERAVVPIMGYIGAGAEIDPDYEQVPADGLDQVKLPLALTDDVIGFLVRGDSMLPKYADGAVIVVHRDQVRATASFVGEEAAIRTHDGKRYLKVLMPGPSANTYNLESFNARTIIGVRIAWASEIVVMIPPRQVRRMERRPAKPRRVAGQAARKDVRK